MLVLLDHDETHLHDTAATLTPRASRLCSTSPTGPPLFRGVPALRPEVVFHAAAHKHVPVLEDHPVEAARANVLGTLNVIEASACRRVEPLRAHLDRQGRPALERHGRLQAPWPSSGPARRSPTDAPYCAVRFGNVLGSRGSVIPTFARQIAAGGPVTVTDPA